MSHFTKTVCLRDWWLVNSEEEVEGKTLCVAGLTSTTGQRAIREFSSSPIVEVHDATTLNTADGICILLHGFINKHRTGESGFSPKIFESFVFGFPPNWHDCAASSFIRKHTGTFDQEDVNVSEPHDKMNMAAGATDNTRPITVPSFIPEVAQSGDVNVRKSNKLLGACETVMDLSNVSLEENGNKRKANKNDPVCLVGCNKSSIRTLEGSTLKDNTNVALRFSTLQYESHVHIVQSLVNEDCVVRNESDGRTIKGGKQLGSDSKTRKGNKKEKLTSRFAPGDKEGKVHKSVADAFKNPDEKKLKKISTGASKKKSDSKSKEDVTCTPKRKLKFDSEVSPLNTGENSTSITSSESLSLKRSRSGRLLMPSLDFWRNQKAVYDRTGQVTSIQNGPSVTEISSRGNKSKTQSKFQIKGV